MNVHHLLETYGYIGIFGALFLEYLGIPFPAETILTVSGFAWAKGTFAFLPLYLSALTGTFAGSLVAYFIGLYFGRPFILRYGKYVRITHEKLDQAEEKFKKYTIPILIFSRFLAGVRVLVPYLAGINRTALKSFILYSLIGSLVWAMLFLFIGRFVGHEWHYVQHRLHRYLIPLLAAIAVMIAGIWLLRARNNRKANS
ncbi:alkaline phosphatase [Collibacillus ludicampi]|uniref:Alkaline phosphatase n=1 Tax=Collibacillus ludicampi TaxID=2771369 RepID=A0AAV4LF84_9BACL|nr:DedA family protein [Collibacillus ludicampi]GIM46487.1 alkaline phosphatase [Collibacillus ludicampi]